MPMTGARRLADLIERTITGPMWHGPAVAEALVGITADMAAARPIEGAHTVWELVSHLDAWARIARARLAGTADVEPRPEDDWPPTPEPTSENWVAAVERLHESHRALAADVAALDVRAVDAQMPGRSHTVWMMLHGVAEHGAYHGGQIALLKRALSASRSP